MPILNAPVAALEVAAYWIAFHVVPKAKHFRPELSASVSGSVSVSVSAIQ